MIGKSHNTSWHYIRKKLSSGLGYWLSNSSMILVCRVRSNPFICEEKEKGEELLNDLSSVNTKRSQLHRQSWYSHQPLSCASLELLYEVCFSVPAARWVLLLPLRLKMEPITRISHKLVLSAMSISVMFRNIYFFYYLFATSEMGESWVSPRLQDTSPQ